MVVVMKYLKSREVHGEGRFVGDLSYGYFITTDRPAIFFEVYNDKRYSGLPITEQTG